MPDIEDAMETDVLGFDDEPILPDGWKEGDDIFADAKEFSGLDEIDGSPAAEGSAAENEDINDGVSAPTTSNDGVDGTSADGEPGDSSSDGKDSATNPSRILKVKFNHKEEDIDIGSTSDEDLATYIQKAKAFDAMKNDELKSKYREIYEDQIAAGMTDHVARIVATSECGGKSFDLEDDGAEDKLVVEEKPVVTAPVKQDFASQIKQLQALYPDVKSLPEEVVAAAMSGIDLPTAYSAYRVRQSERTAAATQKENNILKQNAAAAAKAPVRGVTGGGSTKETPKSDFERGFDSDPW